MRLKVVAFVIAALFVTAGRAKAQFTQYTLPGGPDERPEDLKEKLEDDIQRTRYHIGKMRIEPLVGLRDVAYVKNLLGEGDQPESDFTATVGAGLRGYLRTGRKLTWVATVLPEYVWWHEREDARRVNLSYGLTGLGFYNHLTLEVGGRREEQQQIVTPEVLEFVNSRNDSGLIEAELRLSGKLHAFGSYTASRQNNLVDEREDPVTRVLALLDREERLARTGLRWRPRPGWMAELGVERSQVDFERSAADSSNSGTAPVVELVIDRRRFFAQADLAARSLDAREGSRFVRFDGVTGNASVFVETGRLFQAGAYASRNLVYSLSQLYPYLDDRRAGAAVEVALPAQTSLRVYGETGDNRYVAFSPDTPQRTDDLTAYGGQLRMTLPGPLDVLVHIGRVRYDSNLPGGDRSVTTGGLTVSLGGKFNAY